MIKKEKETFSFSIERASQNQILDHLKKCEEEFLLELEERTSLEKYSEKLYVKAINFEAWQHISEGTIFEKSNLIGLISAYCDAFEPHENIAYITNVSVAKDFTGLGIANHLLEMCIEHSIKNKYKEINLEVSKENNKAISLYKKHNFRNIDTKDNIIIMNLKLERNYDDEFKDTSDHKYNYGFDFDIMHPYMIKSFIPFFKEGNLLELGSFKGDFTRRLLPYFQDITCMEASKESVEIAQEEFGDRIKIINSLFETATLPTKYDNIILTHVLEHLDDPVAVLKKIREEWLSDKGKLFIVCPNANAPSRQIAVKMGLVSHNSAITSSEEKHGHRITYSLDTLERDSKLAGLSVAHRSGIFFKALANFQWDQLLETDIISPEYLEGCYQLGHQYPDLCSSIFLVCEK